MEIVGVVSTAFLALAALFTTGVNYFLLRESFDPHVIVYTRGDPDRPTLIELVIENIGKGVAYDVSFEWHGELPQTAYGITPSDEPREFDPMTKGPLVDGIPLLAPGEARVLNWGQYGGLRDAIDDGRLKVTAAFQSRGRHPWNPTRHVVESVLEVRSFAATNAAKSADRSQVDALEKIAKHSGKIADILKDPVYKGRIEKLSEKMGWGEDDSEDAPAEEGGSPA